MKKLAFAAVVLGLFGLTAVNTAVAADKDDPTGTWKFKVKRGDQEFEQTLKLELKDGKLTGTMGGGKQETKIEEGTFKDGEVAFSVTRTRNDVKIVTKYNGKVSGDEIKGKIKSTRDGKDTEADWVAKKEAKKE